MKPIENIKDLGLSDQEASTYLALVKLGGSRASAIAKEVGVKRTTIYAILKSLAQKSFVAVYFRKNHRFYYAEKPHRVAGSFAKKVEAFESAIPALETLGKKHTQAFGLRFIETLDELKQFYRAVLDEYKNRMYRVISSGEQWEGLDPDWFVRFRKERGEHKIRTRLILSPQFKSKNPTDPALRRTCKYVPEKYSFKSTIDIYDDKVLVISPQLSSLAVVIAIPAMVDVFKSVFDVLWEQLGS